MSMPKSMSDAIADAIATNPKRRAFKAQFLHDLAVLVLDAEAWNDSNWWERFGLTREQAQQEIDTVYAEVMRRSQRLGGPS